MGGNSARRVKKTDFVSSISTLCTIQICLHTYAVTMPNTTADN